MNQLPQKLLYNICETYGLGTCKTVTQIHGGLVHRLWKLTTTTGTYAIKELRSDMRERSNAYKEFSQSEHYARVFSRAGIPAVPALKHGDEVIFHQKTHSVAVYPWIEGAPQKTLSLEHTRKVASLLADLHSASKAISQTGKFWHILNTAETWEQTAALVRKHATHLAWSERFFAFLPTILEWTPQFPAAYEALEDNLLIGHRDLNQQNILWDSNDTPHLIDWESSGTTNPTLELVGTLLEWCKDGPDSVDRAHVDAFLRSYRHHHQIASDEVRAALLAKTAEWIDWFKFSIERAILPQYAHEKEIGEDEVEFSLTWLPTLIGNIDRYTDWIS